MGRAEASSAKELVVGFVGHSDLAARSVCARPTLHFSMLESRL